MLQDVTLKTDSVIPEDIQEISKVILQESKKAIQNMQKEVDKITADKNEEVSRLRDHSEKLLTQIKKLKKDKKLLEKKGQQLVEKKVSKFSNVEIQVEEKTNIDPVNMTTQEEGKSVEENTHLYVAVQMIKIPSEGYVTNSTTSSPEVNQKISTHLIRESQTKKFPYRHLNHESRQLNHAMYRDHSEQKQQTDVPVL